MPNNPDDQSGSSKKDEIVAVLRNIFDPEIPVSLYDLGLIYGLEIDDAGVAQIKMTLTTPACPVAGSLPGEVATKVKAIEGLTDAVVELVWDPPWNMSMMSEAAKLQLNLDSQPPSPPAGSRYFDLNPPRR